MGAYSGLWHRNEYLIFKGGALEWVRQVCGIGTWDYLVTKGVALEWVLSRVGGGIGRVAVASYLADAFGLVGYSVLILIPRHPPRRLSLE